MGIDHPLYSLASIGMLTEELDHPECAVWSPRGVIHAGGEAGQIYEVGLDGTVTEIARGDGEILGLAVDGGGRIFACDTGLGGVAMVDPLTGEMRPYSAADLELPNSACFDAAGNLYVTDSGEYLANDGAVYRIDPGGETAVWSRAPSRYPNGCCLDEAGTALYVVESYLPGVSRIPILPDGSAGTPQVVVELPGTVPDGIAFDARGGLYITCYRPDRVYRLDPTGGLEVLVDDPHGAILCAPTNVAFVGDRLDRMVIANVGEWHLGLLDVGVSGLALRYPTITD